MIFTDTKEIKKAIKTYRKTSDGRTMYSIKFKEAVVTFHSNNWSGPTTKFLKETGISNHSFYLWKRQVKDDMYNEDAAFAVSHSAKSGTSQVIKDLQGQLKVTQQKLDLVRQCEKLGLKVTIAA